MKLSYRYKRTFNNQISNKIHWVKKSVAYVVNELNHVTLNYSKLLCYGNSKEHIHSITNARKIFKKIQITTPYKRQRQCQA